MNAIVFALDRLNAGFLGCYGNLQTLTPNFDRLASESVVFESHFGENFDSDAVQHAWWTGCFTFPRNAEQQRGQTSFVNTLHNAGVQTVLLRDVQSVIPGWESAGFEMLEAVKAEPDEHDSPQATQRVVDCACRHLVSLRDARDAPWLLWISVSGLPADVPYASDDLWEANVHALDESLGQLFDALSMSDLAEEPLFVLTAAAGTPRETQQTFQERPMTLSESLIHTPLLVRVPKQTSQAHRRAELVQTLDLAPTLLRWFGVDSDPSLMEGVCLPAVCGDDHEAKPRREFICLGHGPDIRAIRTDDFYLVDEGGDLETRAAENPHVRLFEKPDDLWEVNDVKEQAPGQTELLRKTLHQFLLAAQQEVPLTRPLQEVSSIAVPDAPSS